MGVFDIVRFIVQHPIGGKHPVRNVADFVRWQVASRLAPGPVIVDWIAGTRVVAERGMAGITGNLYVGLHEPSEMGFALHLLRPDDVFVDIGANVGSYTVLAGGVVGARVHSFEPVAATFEKLMRNVRLNDLGGRVDAHQAALGAEQGQARMQSTHDSVNRVLEASEVDADAVEVTLTTLDAFLPGLAPTLIKIDVEGFELAVLTGARETLARTSAVLIEVSRDRGQVIDALRSSGLEPVSYDPLTRRLDQHAEPHFTRGGNTLFVRDVAWARSRCESAPRFLIKGVAV